MRGFCFAPIDQQLKRTSPCWQLQAGAQPDEASFGLKINSNRAKLPCQSEKQSAQHHAFRLRVCGRMEVKGR